MYPQLAIELRAHGELSLAASLLVDLANEHGGPDNVTCVLARLGGGWHARRRGAAGQGL